MENEELEAISEEPDLIETPKRRIIKCSATRNFIKIPVPFSDINITDILDFGNNDKRLISGYGGFYIENDKMVTGESITTESIPAGNWDSIFLREYKRVSDFAYRQFYELEVPFEDEHQSSMLQYIQWRLTGR